MGEPRTCELRKFVERSRFVDERNQASTLSSIACLTSNVPLLGPWLHDSEPGNPASFANLDLGLLLWTTHGFA